VRAIGAQHHRICSPRYVGVGLCWSESPVREGHQESGQNCDEARHGDPDPQRHPDVQEAAHHKLTRVSPRHGAALPCTRRNKFSYPCPAPFGGSLVFVLWCCSALNEEKQFQQPLPCTFWREIGVCVMVLVCPDEQNKVNKPCPTPFQQNVGACIIVLLCSEQRKENLATPCLHPLAKF